MYRYETVNSLFEKLKKLIEQGNGDSAVIFLDTRSGVSERIAGSNSVQAIELESGEKLDKAYLLFED